MLRPRLRILVIHPIIPMGSILVIILLWDIPTRVFTSQVIRPFLILIFLILGLPAGDGLLLMHLHGLPGDPICSNHPIGSNPIGVGLPGRHPFPLIGLHQVGADIIHIQVPLGCRVHPIPTPVLLIPPARYTAW